METSILLTLLAVSCSVHHSSQMTLPPGTQGMQPTREVPCDTLSKLHLGGQQVTGSRLVNGARMCGVSSSQIPRSIDELIDWDGSRNAAFGSNLKRCEGVLFNKDLCLTRRQDNMIKQYNRLDSVHGGRWKRKAIQSFAGRWPGNIVPYTIEDNIFSPAESRLIREAMDTWEQGTCLTFRPARPSDPDRIRIMSGSGCYSQLGRTGGIQDLSLGVDLCRTKKVILHELGHAVGLIHEHQRYDRDTMVEIIESNVESGFMNQFDKISVSVADITSTKYDYFSLMHYGNNFFSRNGSITIRTNDPRYQDVIGRVENLSFTDIKAVNLLYQCGDHCPRNVFCINDGYVGPNCQCVCSDFDFTCTARRPAVNDNVVTSVPSAPISERRVGPDRGAPARVQRTWPSTIRGPPQSQTPSSQGQGQSRNSRAGRRVGITEFVPSGPSRRFGPSSSSGPTDPFGPPRPPGPSSPFSPSGPPPPFSPSGPPRPFGPSDPSGPSVQSGSSNPADLRTSLLRTIMRRYPALMESAALSILNNQGFPTWRLTLPPSSSVNQFSAVRGTNVARSMFPRSIVEDWLISPNFRRNSALG